MNTEFLIGEELALMQKQRGICISIIVPTHRLSPERRGDHLEMEKAINKAKEYLHYKYTKEQVKPLLQSLDELFHQIDFDHNAEGLGLFVSSNVKQLVPFFFPVKEKLVVNNQFETRDLLYQVYYEQPYMVLLLTEKGAKLFEGKFNTLSEIKDVHFPLQYEDDYEYNHPVRGSSYVGHAFTKEFERDKSELQEIHYEDFLRQVDETLNSYLVDNTSLVVTGTKKDVAYFRKLTKHKNIAGELHGNYSYAPLSELGSLSWNLVTAWLNGEKQKMITELEEQIGQDRAVTGITASWKAANEGLGLKLLVEKDFSMPGFLVRDDEYNLHLKPPTKQHEILPDAVNHLIEEVLNKNGSVVLVENNSLNDHQHLALLTRY